MDRLTVVAFLALLLLPVAFAHVGYVIEEGELVANAGTDMRWVLGPLRDPAYLGLILVTAIVAYILYSAVSRNKRFKEWEITLEAWMGTYQEFIPWIARLGLGMALLGAGTANVLFSPIVPSPGFHSLQILFGFLLLSGLFTGIVAWLALALYAYAAFTNPYLLGNLDIAAMCLAILAIGSSRPGVDDLFGIRFLAPLTRLRHYVPLILRVGIGIAFMYLALYEKILNPHLSELVVQRFDLMGAIPVSAAMWVLSAGIIEFAVGLALFIGWRTRLFSAIAFLFLTASFFYFSEAVYSHITLFATLSMLFVAGGGPWSVDALIAARTRPKTVRFTRRRTKRPLVVSGPPAPAPRKR